MARWRHGTLEQVCKREKRLEQREETAQEWVIAEWIAEMPANADQEKVVKLEPTTLNAEHEAAAGAVGEAVGLMEARKIAQDRVEVTIFRARLVQRESARIMTEVSRLVNSELERARAARVRAEEAMAEATRLAEEVETLRTRAMNAVARAKATLAEKKTSL